MADDSRIDDLRRRIHKDPASIAFAQLAEELRQAKRYEEAVTVCRTGLALYPAYLSARVTLGRCLVALNQLDDAQRELEQVRDSAPENLAAGRALADIRKRRAGDTEQSAAGNQVGLPVSPKRSEDGPVPPKRSEGGKPDTTDEVRLRPDATREPQVPETPARGGAEYDRALRTVTALEAWLAAIHVARASRSA